jgi:hypothetical protein
LQIYYYIGQDGKGDSNPMLGIYRKIPHKKWPAYELLELEEGYINISDFSIKNMG